MTTYNVAPYLRSALDSILNQTLSNFEFIIVDDGSNDGSDAILDKYAQSDARIHIFRQENKGLYPALNTGLELCQGKYIARMDADDIAIHNRLEVQASYLSEHEDLALVAGSIQAINADGTNIGYWIWPTSPDDVRNTMLTTMCIFHPAVMVRKDAISAMGGYPTESDSGQDNVLWVKMITNGLKIGNVPEVVIKWRADRPGSITSTRPSRQRLEVLRCRSRLVTYARSPNGWLTSEQERKIQKAFPTGGSPLDNKPFTPDTIELIDPIGSPAIQGDLASCMRSWLVGKDTSAEISLLSELQRNGHYFLASLINHSLSYNERQSVIASYCNPPTTGLSSLGEATVTIVLPWSDDLNDLQQRLECLKQSTKPADEIILLAPNSELDDAAKGVLSNLDNLTTIHSNNELQHDLYTARTQAKGNIIGYLFPYHRYHPDFINTGSALLSKNLSPLVFANRIDHYSRTKIEGRPLDDILLPFPGDRASILGQEGRIPLGYLANERIYLSGFLHTKEGGWECLIPLDKCVPEYDWIIAMDWAYRIRFDVLPLCNKRIRENFHFEDRLWKAFLRATIQKHFETAFGLLTDTRPLYKPRELGNLLDKLRCYGYPIHSRNRLNIFSTFLQDVSTPWRYTVFREMCQWNLSESFSDAKQLGGWKAGAQVLIAWSLSLMTRLYSKVFLSNSRV